jgi:hypothetical protein
MAFFKRNDQGTVQQASAAPSGEGKVLEQSAALMPPVVTSRGPASSGVVPPPAAPMYSVSLPDAGPRAEGDAASLIAERVRVARDRQQSVQQRLRLSVQRERAAASPARNVRRRALQTPVAAATQSRPSFDPTRCAQTRRCHTESPIV